MREPWEVFYDEWCAVARSDGWIEAGARREPSRFAAATSHAAAETVRMLRESRDWSLVYSRLLVGYFVEAADQWAAHGRGEAQLKEWLRATWAARLELRRLEQERRWATEAVLAG